MTAKTIKTAKATSTVDPFTVAHVARSEATYRICERANIQSLNMLERVRLGDTDGAVRHIEEEIRALQAALKDWGLELTEVLPGEDCNACGRNALEFVREGERIVCNLCQRDRAEEGSTVATDGVTRDGVLELARAAVGDRAGRHGSPSANFPRIAHLWSNLLGRPVSAIDVALCLAALKLVRASVNPQNVDNWVDMAGYAGCGGEIAQARVPA